MKIILLTNNFPPVVDGVGDYTYHLASQMADKGYQVYVICSKKKEIEEYWFKKKSNFTVIPLVSYWQLKYIHCILRQVSIIKPAWIVLQYVPHAFNYYGIPFVITYLFFRLHIAKYHTATMFHEVAIRLEWSKPKYVPIALLQRLIAWTISLMSQQIITSIGLYSNMLRYGSKKLTRIPVGTNILPITIPQSAIMAFKSKIAPAGEFILCAFGSNLRKNDLLIKVAADLIASSYKIKLLFLGKLTALQSEKIKRSADQLQLSDQVITPGYLSSDDVFLYLSCSDVFLQIEEITGKNQGGISTKSGAIAAAYAAGLPIIGTKGDMTDAFFKDSENVLLVEADDKVAIKNNIIYLIEHDNSLLTFKRNAFQTYCTYLKWPVLLNQYEKILTP